MVNMYTMNIYQKVYQIRIMMASTKLVPVPLRTSTDYTYVGIHWSDRTKTLIEQNLYQSETTAFRSKQT